MKRLITAKKRRYKDNPYDIFYDHLYWGTGDDFKGAAEELINYLEYGGDFNKLVPWIKNAKIFGFSRIRRLVKILEKEFDQDELAQKILDVVNCRTFCTAETLEDQMDAMFEALTDHADMFFRTLNDHRKERDIVDGINDYIYKYPEKAANMFITAAKMNNLEKNLTILDKVGIEITENIAKEIVKEIDKKALKNLIFTILNRSVHYDDPAVITVQPEAFRILIEGLTNNLLQYVYSNKMDLIKVINHIKKEFSYSDDEIVEMIKTLTPGGKKQLERRLPNYMYKLKQKIKGK